MACVARIFKMLPPPKLSALPFQVGTALLDLPFYALAAKTKSVTLCRVTDFPDFDCVIGGSIGCSAGTGDDILALCMTRHTILFLYKPYQYQNQNNVNGQNVQQSGQCVHRTLRRRVAALYKKLWRTASPLPSWLERSAFETPVFFCHYTYQRFKVNRIFQSFRFSV